MVVVGGGVRVGDVVQDWEYKFPLRFAVCSPHEQWRMRAQCHGEQTGFLRIAFLETCQRKHRGKKRGQGPHRASTPPSQPFKLMGPWHWEDVEACILDYLGDLLSWAQYGPGPLLQQRGGGRGGSGWEGTRGTGPRSGA